MNDDAIEDHTVQPRDSHFDIYSPTLFIVSLKDMHTFEFGSIVGPAAWPDNKQPICHSQKIKARFSQPRTLPFSEAQYVYTPFFFFPLLFITETQVWLLSVLRAQSHASVCQPSHPGNMMKPPPFGDAFFCQCSWGMKEEGTNMDIIKTSLSCSDYPNLVLTFLYLLTRTGRGSRIKLLVPLHFTKAAPLLTMLPAGKPF